MMHCTSDVAAVAFASGPGPSSLLVRRFPISQDVPTTRRVMCNVVSTGFGSAAFALLAGVGVGLATFRRSRRRRAPMQKRELSLNIPKHIGFIMDGNRRHAQAYGRLQSDYGPGLDAFIRVMRWCAQEPGIERATFFVLSTENLKRQESVEDIISRSANRVIQTAKAIGAIVRFVSTDVEELSSEARETMARVQRETDMDGPVSLHVDLLVAYGGCSDVAGACRSIASDIATGSLTPSAVNESLVAARLATAPASWPDLVVRTKERRLSNFTMFQSAYSEITFLEDVLWPEMSEQHLERVMEDYSKRTRRYGI